LRILPELDEGARLVKAVGGLWPVDQLTDEITEWAAVLKVDLETGSGEDLETFAPDMMDSAQAVTKTVAWRIGRVRLLLETLGRRLPASAS